MENSERRRVEFINSCRREEGITISPAKNAVVASERSTSDVFGDFGGDVREREGGA